MKILVECKPATVPLNLNHASQLFRYFTVTDTRLAILTNGVVFQFYSDIEAPNKMDEKPFFTFSMDVLKPADIKTLEKFRKGSFDIERIVREAGALKLQSLLRKELERELAAPSEEFVRMMAGRVHDGRITPQVRDNFAKQLSSALSTLVRDLVTDRLSSALHAANSQPDDDVVAADDETVTTPDEVSGFHIVQAIATKLIHPERIAIRDRKSYCAIVLDDNNRKTIARLHFNRMSTKYLGVLKARGERRHALGDISDIYQYAGDIEARINELTAPAMAKKSAKVVRMHLAKAG